MNRHGLVLTITLASAALPLPALAQCPASMVQSGPTCIDRFEASLWKVTDPVCIALARQGREWPPFCRQQSTQVGINGVDYTDAQCQFNGAGCTNLFALSLSRRR